MKYTLLILIISVQIGCTTHNYPENSTVTMDSAQYASIDGRIDEGFDLIRTDTDSSLDAMFSIISSQGIVILQLREKILKMEAKELPEGNVYPNILTIETIANDSIYKIKASKRVKTKDTYRILTIGENRTQ